MRAFRQFISNFNSKIIMWVLIAVIGLHVGLMFYFLQTGRQEQHTAKRDQVIQKIINTIYLVEATPVANRQHAVQVLEDPDLQVSFNHRPLWPQQFRDVSFWQIADTLQKDFSDFALSIRLDHGQWLNIKATIYTRVLTTQLIWFSVEILIFSMIFLLIYVVNRYQRPLLAFRQAAEKLGPDFDAKAFDIRGPATIRETAHALNAMQQRIRDLVRDRTQMLAAISHDLRTPITRMKIRTQFIEDTSEQRNMVSDLDEMEKMISEILAFARDDANKGDKTQLDLVSLLYSICNDFRDTGAEIAFTTSLHRQPFWGRPIALKRAFSNLITNAIRYGKNVKIKLKKHGNFLVITIDDSGSGIPETELERVFEPFYRAEQSRSRDTGGVGLGLAVTREIIRAHSGEIKLKNRLPHGLRVQIVFSIYTDRH